MVTARRCDECGEWTPEDTWIKDDDLTLPCDLCGDHPASKCPKCDELGDDVREELREHDRHQAH